jgi:acetyl-CoA carboxylase biotin carboxyl carrier protein
VVTEDASNTPGPFNLATVKALVQLMARHSLDEIDLHQGDQRIRLRRIAGRLVPQPAAVEPAAGVEPASAPPRAAPAAAKVTPPAGKAFYEIKSELVGTFYASREPGAEAFVRVGSRVKRDDVLCLVEAMKVFNEVTADRDGVIVEICVQNQQPVEFGQVLFRLDPTG